MRTLSLEPDSIELFFPMEGLSIPRRHPHKGYPTKFLQIARRYDALHAKCFAACDQGAGRDPA